MRIKEDLYRAIRQHKGGQLQDAERLYRNILKFFPNHPEVNHNLAILIIQKGLPEQAIPFFHEALAADANQGAYWVNYIDTLICVGEYDKARLLLSHGRQEGLIGDAVDQLEAQLNVDTELKKRPSRIQTDFITALLHKGQAEEALDALNKIFVHFPDYPLLYNLKGACYAQLGQHTTAISSYQTAIKLHPDFADVHNNLGFTFQDLGQLHAAIRCYQQSIKISPQYAEAHNNLGTAYNELGQFKLAVECFEQALTVQPNYAEAHNNLGNAQQNLNRLAAATISYKNAITIRPDFPEAHNNLGNVLQERGQLKAAIKSFKRALEIKPDFAQAHYNMGNTLKDLCLLDITIESYEQAVKLNPDYAQAYYNLANTLKEVGKFESAVDRYTQALQINPEYAEAHNNLGNVLYKLDQPIQALSSIQQALSIAPENPLFWETFVAVLQGVQFNSFNAPIIPFIQQALERPNVRPSDISLAIMSNLRHHPQLKSALKTYKTSNADNTQKIIVELLNSIPLLLQLMTLTPLPDPETEALLTYMRRSLLKTLSGNNTQILPPFYSALAIHCFINDYVFAESDDETAQIIQLENKINLLVTTNKLLPSSWLVILANYRPLHQYSWDNQLLTPHYQNLLDLIIERQIIEIKEEQQIRTEIHKVTPITNSISQSVRDQYEQHPYPRWVNAGLYSTPLSIEKALENLELNLDLNKQSFNSKPEILIAGCGTGQHALNTATRFVNSSVLAIDLSLTSLSYAIRKTQQASINNIEYMQADILELSQLNRQFDLIESVGVLHHMADPYRGWSILKDLLRPQGLMKIGLYSDLARQAIVASRDFIKMKQYAPSAKAIRECRTEIMALAKEDPEANLGQVLTIPDFYSLSECRDLLFHIQEYRFTLPEIEIALQQLGLQFIGFELGHSQTLNKFKRLYPSEKALFSLSDWHQFECQHPDTFRGMYQFWVKKIE